MLDDGPKQAQDIVSLDDFVAVFTFLYFGASNGASARVSVSYIESRPAVVNWRRGTTILGGIVALLAGIDGVTGGFQVVRSAANWLLPKTAPVPLQLGYLDARVTKAALNAPLDTLRDVQLMFGFRNPIRFPLYVIKGDGSIIIEGIRANPDNSARRVHAVLPDLDTELRIHAVRLPFQVNSVQNGRFTLQMRWGVSPERLDRAMIIKGNFNIADRYGTVVTFWEPDEDSEQPTGMKTGHPVNLRYSGDCATRASVS